MLVFYYFNTEYAQRRYGIVDTQGEVIVPIEHEYIGVLSHFNTQRAPNISASERFFLAREHSEGPAALISPDGNFLTGFDYTEIFHMSGNNQIVGRHTDGRLVFLDYYGVESEIEDARIIYTIESLDKSFYWREEYAWLITGPGIPTQGLSAIMRTRTGNFWGAANLLEGQPWSEIRLYNPQGSLLNGDVYHLVSYIGDGLYLAEFVGEGFSRESYIVNPNGRRLAGPYHDILQYSSSYFLGILGDTAFALSADSFHEIRSIEIPTDGQISISNVRGRPIAELTSETLPTTLIFLDTGEEIVFGNLISRNSRLLQHNHDLSRFIFSGSVDEVVLTDRQGNILAEGHHYLADNGVGHLVAVYRDEEGSLRYSLMDWDGNILLGPEFSFMQPLPGNALHVIREGIIGIIDLGGNWIYVFQTNHPRHLLVPYFLDPDILAGSVSVR